MLIDKHWIAQLPIKNIKFVTPVSGGFMNATYCLQTDDHQKYFMKMQPGKGKRFFQYEVDGLKLVSQAATVPKLVTYGQVGSDGYLILKWQKFMKFDQGNQYELGKMVAKMHQIHAKRFGFNYGFHLGDIPKDNHWQTSWSTFYVKQRLDPSVKYLKQHGGWSDFRERHYRKMRQAFIDYYADPKNKVIPSLLHGDLWSGNCEFTTDGKPMLIDPNVIFGDRELDLSLTKMPSSYGNFNAEFYRGYNNVYPSKPGFEHRMWWYQFNYVLNDAITFNNVGKKSGIDQLLAKF